MDLNWIIYSYLVLFTLSFLVELLLDSLQLKNQKDLSNFDELIKQNFSTEILAKAISYTKTKIKFGIFSHFYSSITLLIILFSGILVLLGQEVESLTSFTLINQAIYVLLITFVMQIISWPISLYSTFKIEQEFGFNQMTIKLWLLDLLKSIILGVVIAGPLLLAILAILKYLPETWWIWAFLLMTSFQLLLLYLYPVWIAPIFNKFKKLPEGDLREQIFELSAKLKFPLQEVFIMDGSRRSSHGNAYFTGFGKNQRIVLFDTLEKDLTTIELVAVLAHEIGHKKLKHVPKQLVYHTLGSLVVFYVLSLVFYYEPIYQAFGFAGADNGVGLILIPIILGPVFYFFSPLNSILSRKYEYQADDYAREAMGAPEPLSSALVKLHESNLANLNPHPAYTFFHHSHPTLVERLKNLNNK